MVEPGDGEPGEIADVLIADERVRVRVLTFTGSSAVGWDLKARSPRKRHVLELGSNTGAVVAADADLDRVVECVTTAAFVFSGQACVALQRLYVVRPVAEELTARLAAAADAVVAGDPSGGDVAVGPLISDDALARVEAWMAEAVAGGGRIVPADPGWAARCGPRCSPMWIRRRESSARRSSGRCCPSCRWTR